MHLARADFERHARQRPHPGKCLLDVAHLEQGAAGSRRSVYGGAFMPPPWRAVGIDDDCLHARVAQHG